MIVRLALALSAVWILDRWLPLPDADPLRGTVALLPLIVAGLLEIGRWAQARCTPVRRIQPGYLEAAALGLLVLLTLARPHLGLQVAAQSLMTGFVVLLALRVIQLTRALGPALGDRLPRRPPAAFFFLPLLVYLAIVPWSAGQRPPDGDEPYFLLITHSLAYDGDTALDNNYANRDWSRFLARDLEPQPGDPIGSQGRQYSRHSPLLPLFLVPAYRLGGLLGAMAMMAIFAAALTWLTLRVAALYFPDRPGAALAAWAVLAFTPPLLVYSQQIWVEVPAALLTLLALDRILRLGDDGEGFASWAGVILPIALLPLLKLRFALLAAPLVVLAVVRCRRRRYLGTAIAILGALGSAQLLYNVARYGNPLRYRSVEEIKVVASPVAHFLRGFVGLFFDSTFGLIAAAPIWWLLLPAAILLLASNQSGGGQLAQQQPGQQQPAQEQPAQEQPARQLRAGRRSPLLWHLPLLAVPLLLFVTPRLEWYAGWSPAFRYGLVILPLLCLTLIPLLDRWRSACPGTVAAATTLTAFTLILTLVYLVAPAWTFNLAHGRSQLLDHLSLRLGADLARFFPSYVRLRAASYWWPPISLALAGWMVWRLGRQPAAAYLRAGVIGGILAALLLPALLPWAAHHLPSRVIEFEDPPVVRSGGDLYPEIWTLARPRFRGGWLLQPGSQLSAPVIVGRGDLTLALDLRYRAVRGEPPELRILAGETLLGTWPAVPCNWCTIRFADLDWPAGEPLVLEWRPTDQPGGTPRSGVDRPLAGGHLIVDRAHLTWGDRGSQADGAAP